MIQCPNCRAMIPDDSAFCDQCGTELMWCPDCKRPKPNRTHECPVCGSDLVPGRKYLNGIMAQPQTAPQQTQQPNPSTAILPHKMWYRSHNPTMCRNAPQSVERVHRLDQPESSVTVGCCHSARDRSGVHRASTQNSPHANISPDDTACSNEQRQGGWSLTAAPPMAHLSTA